MFKGIACRYAPASIDQEHGLYYADLNKKGLEKDLYVLIGQGRRIKRVVLNGFSISICR